MKLQIRLVPAGVAAALMAGLVGCTDENAKRLAEMNTSNIQRLSNFYAGFQNGKGGKGPKDEAEFKEFIKAHDAERLRTMGFDPGNVDAAFTSERDGQPFKIRWKVGGGRGSVAPVVFEAVGKDGKKQVGFTGGKVEEVDDATYQQYWSGKGGAEPPAGPPTGAKGGGGRPGKGGPPPGAPTGPPK
ncbi:MAG TPA: hypothetical protein VFG68_16060 [Fimbriiglobus sp.]|nr:hypothetical protein [Fimbriiglobus sp.]